MAGPATPGVIDIEDRGSMEVIGNPVHAGVFELARRFKRGASMAELVAASGLPERSPTASTASRRG